MLGSGAVLVVVAMFYSCRSVYSIEQRARNCIILVTGLFGHSKLRNLMIDVFSTCLDFLI